VQRARERAKYSSGPLLDSPRPRVPQGVRSLPATSILLVDSDRSSAESIAEVLRTSGHTVAVANDYKSARTLVSGRRVVILVGSTRRTRALDLCREIRASHATAMLPILAIVAPEAATERVRWFDAGADDVLVQPFDERELEARIEALLVRFERSQQLQTPDKPATASRRVLTFLGAKGGVGTTTAAVNAGRAIVDLRPKSVAIADLDLQRGQVATLLNLTPQGSIVQAAQDGEAISDASVFGSYLERHPSGLDVLAAPSDATAESEITVEQLRAVVAHLTASHEIVVIDAGSRIDERTLAAVELADDVVFVFAADMASLKALKMLVRGLGGTGAAMSRTTFLLNHIHAREQLKRPEIEGIIGARIGFELPYDGELYQMAVNHGVPLLRGAPDSGPANAFRELGAFLVGEHTDAEDDGRVAGRRRRLAEVLRR
jgi:pilus assembly protein CpaE